MEERWARLTPRSALALALGLLVVLVAVFGLPSVVDETAAASSSPGFTVRQGETTFEATPLSNGETAEGFYGYWSAESHTTTGVERPRTSLAFLWEGPYGISLVLIHGGPDDDDGGAVSMAFDGLPSGSWDVRDDWGDWEKSRNPPTKIDWAWHGDHNDGGVYGGDFGASTSLTIDPAFNLDAERDPLSRGVVTEWQFLTGDPADPERITLDMSQPLEIFGGDLPPTDPTNVRASGGPAPGQITVNWTEPRSEGDQPLQGYNVYRAPSPDDPPQKIAEVDAGERSYIDDPPGDGGERTYWVSAFSASGESLRGGPDCAVPPPREPLEGCSPPGGQDVFQDGFEEGSADWLPFYPWHETVEGRSAFPKASQGRVSFWFGQASTGTYEGTYENGRSYDLASPVVDLRATEAPVLAFDTWYETEDPEANVDEKTLVVAEPGTNGRGVLKEVPITGEDGFRQWTTEVVDLAAFTDRRVELRFRFTPSPTDNAHRGWYVDHVRVFEDHDTDGLPTGRERLAETDPSDADTDGDGTGDREDARPVTEDVPPDWGYWASNPFVSPRPTEIVFHNEQGIVRVNATPPVDNVGLGEVWFALELGGQGSDGPANATLRFQLHEDEDGRYKGVMPLPRNFEGGRATFEKFVLAAADVNGNWASHINVNREELVFRHGWENRTQDGYAYLESVDLPDDDGSASQTQTDTSLTRFVLRPGPDGAGLATSRSPDPGDPPSALVIPTGIPYVSAAQGLGPAGFISGLEEASAEHLHPGVHGFTFGCDEKPTKSCFAGDATASFLVVGDIRDFTVGTIQHDRTDIALGGVGMALEVNQGADGLFATLKPALKVIDDASRSLRDALIKAIKDLPRQADNPKAFKAQAGNLKVFTYTVVKNLDDSPKMADRLLRFDEAVPGRPLTAFSDEAAVKATDDLVAKYGADFETLAAKLADDTSRLNRPTEDMIALAKAEARFGEDSFRHAAKIAEKPHVQKAVEDIRNAGVARSTKGQVFELETGARLSDDDSLELLGIRLTSSGQEADTLYRRAADDEVVARELKNRRSVDMEADGDQLRRLAEKVDGGDWQFNTLSGKPTVDRVEVQVAEGTTVGRGYLEKARELGIDVFTESGELLT